MSIYLIEHVNGFVIKWYSLKLVKLHLKNNIPNVPTLCFQRDLSILQFLFQELERLSKQPFSRYKQNGY